MRIRFSSRAYRDLENIAEYFAEENPVIGTAIIQAIETSLSRLITMPQLGRATNEPNVRRLILPRYPYAIFYQIEGETVAIITIFHTSRDPKDAL